MAEASLTGSAPGARRDIESIYADLEAERRHVIRTFWLTIGRCILLIPVALLPVIIISTLMAEHAWTVMFPAAASHLQQFLKIYGTPVVLSGLAWVFVGLFIIGRHFHNKARKPKWQYVRNFKTKMYTSLCETHFPNLAYDYDGYIGWDEFEATGLFPYQPDWYLSEDYFSGKIGATDIYFCEAHAKRERRDWTSKNNRKYYDTYFRGLVFVADFHKHFHSTSRLIPAGEKLQRVPGQQAVEFADPEFNDLFTTTSTDQTDVRYILSSSMLQRFVQLHRRFPKLRARFDRDKLMLMLPINRDLFEPSLYRRADSKVQLNALVKDIETVMPIVDELNLNTRIWSKV